MFNKCQLNLFFLLVLNLTNCNASAPFICLNRPYATACYEGAWIRALGSTFASFQGIRYAQPPLNELRFKPPIPYYDEGGIYDVSKESNITCVQLKNGVALGQEDCLFLNVYVPDWVLDWVLPSPILPVMVWIHGGGLQTGSNSYAFYGPQHFTERDVIIVSINYRLGPFGFFSMGNDIVPGNTGFRDQVMALSWVQENIAYFGGNPKMVTIFGESAGSYSVALQLISPLSKGLFHRAILESGTALAPASSPNTPEHALRYANMSYERLGCDDESVYPFDTLICMQKKEIGNRN